MLSLLQTKGRNLCRWSRTGDDSNRDWEDSYRQRWQFDKIVVPPTVLTVQAPVAGKSTLKMSGDLGNPTDRLPAHSP